MKKKYETVLASASPRRKEILEALGIRPTVVVSGADEGSPAGKSAEEYAEETALRKIAPVAASHCSENAVVIAADTVVCFGNEIFGKPRDRADAERMLGLLSGNTHKVITGYAVSVGGRIASGHEVTEVRFRTLADGEAGRYVTSDPPYDKAGAYGIQDKASVFVEGINGDYFNVVGLPVFAIFETLGKEFGISFFDIVGAEES